MSYELQVYDSKQAAALIGLSAEGLRQWLFRHPEYRPARRISGDDLLWTPADIERVREARQAKAKHGNRYKNKQ